MKQRYAVFLALAANIFFAHGQGTWTQLTSVPAGGRFWATAFVIDGKAYAGTGTPSIDFGTVPFADLWEYDPGTDAWTQKADFPGGPREGVISASHGGFGYAGFGSPGFGMTNDWYKYDPVANSWSTLASCPASMWYGRGFVLDDKFYAGPESGTNAMHVFDFTTETWGTAATFPGTYSIHQVTFTLNGKGYLGMGLGLSDDWWSYDPVNDTWTQVATISPASDQSCGFSFDGDGYCFNVGANLKDLYRYDPIADTWTFVNNFPGDRIANAEGFAIGSSGYIVFGERTLSGSNVPSDQLWRFDPGGGSAIGEAGSPSAMHVVSRPGGLIQLHLPRSFVGGSVSIRDVTGRELITRRIGSDVCEFETPGVPMQLLVVEARSKEGQVFATQALRLP